MLSTVSAGSSGSVRIIVLASISIPLPLAYQLSGLSHSLLDSHAALGSDCDQIIFMLCFNISTFLSIALLA